MTTTQLVTALEEGKLLQKDWAHSSGPNFGYYTPHINIQYLFQNKHFNGTYYETKGWGSYGSKDTALLELFNHPDWWTISEHTIEDRPWRTIKSSS